MIQNIRERKTLCLGHISRGREIPATSEHNAGNNSGKEFNTKKKYFQLKNST